MRVSIVSMVLAGGMLTLGACAATGDSVSLTPAERAEVCGSLARTEVVPTGRQTGDVRNDYECRSVHANGAFDRRDRNVGGSGAARSLATDRALRGG